MLIMNNNKMYKLLKPQTTVKLLKLMLVPTNPPVSKDTATIRICCILFVIFLYLVTKLIICCGSFSMKGQMVLPSLILLVL